MRFEHPELLYALLLLVIPLIVHLFRLRKFQKEEFTNVKFLKKVVQETRKSSRLKKFLILITRLLMLASIILAFAKPYIPSTQEALQEVKNLIYLDNSFSLQARTENSSIFQTAIEELLESLNSTEEYSLLTNSGFYRIKTGNELRSILQEIQLTGKQLKSRDIYIRASDHFKDQTTTLNKLIIISDFQNRLDFKSPKNKENFKLDVIKLQAEKLNNISIDTAYIAEEDPERILLNISATSVINSEDPVIVSVYDADKLLCRRSLIFSERTKEIQIELKNQLIKNGYIKIEDNGLSYDDILYFNISEKSPIKVIAISEAVSDFLTKIYTQPDFDFQNVRPGDVDYNILNNANLIILNEVSDLSSTLSGNINNALKDGSKLIIIPASELESSMRNFVGNLGFRNIQLVKNERLVTGIMYDHPLLKNVFEDRTQNFDYPKTQVSYNLQSAAPILKFQDNSPFLAASGSTYIFSAPINIQNSNFQYSPLIVPVFYQIGLETQKPQQLYYNLEISNKIDVPVKLAEDRVLHLENRDSKLIPLQQNYNEKVEITTDGISLEAGNYQLTADNENYGTLSFNSSRAESELTYTDLENLELYPSVKKYFTSSNATREITELWKWFVIFALIFLGIEILLIKLLK
ncbi:BatA domain-containing protein [Christiangramia aquimixticola]|uniref:BatA domain-containing protein n=1 Tax=Christiangramia aquimixticola TaxID=1697558 RepID=UPI003AA832D8